MYNNCYIGMMDAPSLGFFAGIIIGIIIVGYLCINAVVEQNKKFRKLKDKHGDGWWKYI